MQSYSCGNLQTVGSIRTFWETPKPRSNKKLKWFRHQPYIHSIYRHSILAAEDTRVSPIAVHMLVGNTENQPGD